MSLVSNLAILIGFMLLILPGIWLGARWLATTPILFAEDSGAFEALDRSAARMTPMLPAAALAMLVVYLPWLAGMAAIVVMADSVAIVPSAAINVALTLSQVGLWYLAVAAFRATMPESLESVFD